MSATAGLAVPVVGVVRLINLLPLLDPVRPSALPMWLVPCPAVVVEALVEVRVLVLVLSSLVFVPLLVAVLEVLAILVVSLVSVTTSQTLLEVPLLVLLVFLRLRLLVLLKTMSNRTELVGVGPTVLPDVTVDLVAPPRVLLPSSLRLPPLSTFLFLYCCRMQLRQRL